MLTNFSKIIYKIFAFIFLKFCTIFRNLLQNTSDFYNNVFKTHFFKVSWFLSNIPKNTPTFLKFLYIFRHFKNLLTHFLLRWWLSVTPPNTILRHTLPRLFSIFTVPFCSHYFPLHFFSSKVNFFKCCFVSTKVHIPYVIAKRMAASKIFILAFIRILAVDEF